MKRMTLSFSFVDSNSHKTFSCKYNEPNRKMQEYIHKRRKTNDHANNNTA